MNEVETITFEPDDAPPLDEDKLDRITRLARLQIEQERAVAEAEEALARAKEALRRTNEADLPDALAAAGLGGLPLADGHEVEVERQIFASIPIGRKPEAFEWFEQSGNGPLIKNVISLALPRGQNAVAGRIVRGLQKLNDELDEKDRFEIERKQQVHPQTLQAFVRREENAGRGHELPDDLLGIHRRTVSKIVYPEPESF